MGITIDEVASSLYRSGCINFGTFKIKSGAESPYYIDMARLLSSPKELCTIIKASSSIIRKIMMTEKIDKIASIELKGALIAPSIACSLNLPCIIVRKEAKTYGNTGRIAGARTGSNCETSVSCCQPRTGWKRKVGEGRLRSPRSSESVRNCC
jgi:orotate phosphoribosyltransferase